MEHDHDRTVHGKALGILKGKRHILFLAAVLMIIALVILHVVFANSIYNAGGFSLKNPLSYLMIGGFLLLAAFKLKYLWRFKNSIGRHVKK
jgi:uncharacterized protein (DUF2062 family)